MSSCQNRAARLNDVCVVSVCQSFTAGKKGGPSLPAESCQSPTQPLSLLQDTFDLEVLFNLLLPPIILHGAYTRNQVRLPPGGRE